MPWMNLPANINSNRVETTLIKHPKTKIRIPVKIIGFLGLVQKCPFKGNTKNSYRASFLVSS
jgi:hypothetical protein